MSLLTANAMAFPCFITVMKGSCWKDYNVKVDVFDAEDNENNKILMHVDIPKGKSWARKAFEAKPKQRFVLRATFKPAFWKDEAGVKYQAKKYWLLPEKIDAKTIAWNVDACFPADFSSVPMPPDAGQNCACDKQKVTPLTQKEMEEAAF
ncbi:MAG: hypothetical protein QNK11_05260 [Legionella sp.]|nr:hypothetical protein [Legionella sp.]